ncbi:class II aldolase/adducin family protein [Endozoicomonas sp. SCSIO W0465]|uniref:class II aldolase/adducin family protein n=1 Tax=Endozoicomonas sp. SCSIO W0465 TaxID=2918516 RepID=UPI00207557C8|nr:class II aldolase/adducin family protein [Endozoicomonas sp. SCSIO W0465]USE36204.1 class II aldolase/adducin family protein [Endozoicomonas sp. SCSIO W0465]
MLVIGGLLQPGDSGQTPGTILIATSTLHESTFPAWWEDVFCLLFAFFSNIRPRLEKKREEFLRLSGISGNIKTNVQSNYDCLMRFWTRTIYRAKPDCQAIVHLHSTYLTALSCLNNLNTDNAIKPFTPYYVMRIGKLPVIPYLRPGHPEIASELARLAPENRAFLLSNHGPVVTGKDLLDACDNAEELEETARLLFMLQDKSVRYLTDDEVNQLNGGQ